MRIFATLVWTLACMLASLQAHAGIVNGSFEDGFFGWQFVGTPDASGTPAALGPHAPTHGASQAFLGAGFALGGSGPGDQVVAGVLGVPLLRILDPNTGEYYTYSQFEVMRQDEGRNFLEWCPANDDCFTSGSAAIYQDFYVERGQRIGFDYNFLGSGRNAFDGVVRAAFATLVVGSSVTVVMLKDNQNHGVGADIDSTFGPLEIGCELVIDCFGSESIVGGATGYDSHALAARESGFARFGVALLPANRGYTNPSALLLDNVRLLAVPEPSTVALLGAGLLGLTWSRRRGRRPGRNLVS